LQPIFKIINYFQMMNKITVLSALFISFCSVSFFNFTSRNIEIDSAALGKKLFMDNILSADYSLSCASCHKPEFAFADTSSVSLGVAGRKGSRNTPSAMNMTARESFFWDGRAATLEQQALKPIENPLEMNLKISHAIERLQNHPEYNQLFNQIYGEKPNANNLARALSDFERSLETNSAYDKFAMGDSFAISAAAQRGLLVFNEKGKCVECHFAADLTGDEFRNIGLFDNRQYQDSGRAAVSKNLEDLGKFKTPSLRNVAITAPYMHDGSFKTLKEIIDYYDQPDKFGLKSINRDTLLNKPLLLTEQEKQDLETFLHTLTAPQFLR
jgi:cytochrome c peroxidase